MRKLKYVLVAVIMLCGSFCFAQKKLEQQIDASGVQGILINTDQIFKIEVFTSKTDKITLKSGIAGENFETIRVESEVKNKVFEIKTSRNPFFEDIDDKLAAHKVTSIILEMKIPENMEFWITSSLAAVTMTGTFKYIDLELGRGDCLLKQFRGNGIINTRTGNIQVATRNCTIDASSRHGNNQVANVPSGNYHLELKSIGGNITVTQSE